jgi:hypothetical protein
VTRDPRGMGEGRGGCERKHLRHPLSQGLVPREYSYVVDGSSDWLFPHRFEPPSLALLEQLQPRPLGQNNLDDSRPSEASNESFINVARRNDRFADLEGHLSGQVRCRGDDDGTANPHSAGGKTHCTRYQILQSFNKFHRR